MFMKKFRLILSLLAVGICCATLLCACGDDEKEKKAKDKKALNAAPGLKKRFIQLDNTLTQLDRESDIQKQKIASARAELQSIHDMLAQGKLEQLGLEEFSTTAVSVVPVSTRESRKANPAEKEEAQNKALGVVSVVLFTLFLIVYFGKLWKDRDYAPSHAPEYGPGDASTGSTASSAVYEYPSTGDNPPAGTDTTATPPLG
jgi:hypothetical protein